MTLLKFIIETTRGLRQYILGFLICSIVISIDANLKPYIIKLMIDSFSSSEDSSYLFLCSIFIVSQVAMVSTYALNDWIGTKFHSNYSQRIPHIFLDKISRYSYRFFQENMSGTITAKISDAFNVIFPIIYNSINVFGRFFVTLSISFVLLFSVSPVIVLILLGWLMFYICFSYFFFKGSALYNKDFAPIRPKLYGEISDYVTNILSVWNFSGISKETERLSKTTHAFKHHATKYGRFLRNSYFAQGISLIVYIVCVLYTLIELKDQNKVTSGDFALVFMISYKIADMLFSIAQEALGFSQIYGQACSAISILDFPSEISDKNDAKPIKISKSPEIRFRHVQFHYNGSNDLFTDQDIVIKPGQGVGLVGPSGCGKSTLINLILRLYDVTGGAILIDGQDIRDVTQDSLRKNIAMIPQDPSLFHRSLMENIRYGRFDATDDEVIAAAKKAHAHEFIEKLPQGYETIVGERGVKLSGGQRQRIAIARAILKDAPILILDEATSALDSQTEKLIQESLWELMTHQGSNRTTIVIAHRLSTLLNMDRIIVMEHGKIVEDGTHSELLARGGLYKKLWDSQVWGFIGGV